MDLILQNAEKVREVRKQNKLTFTIIKYNNKKTVTTKIIKLYIVYTSKAYIKELYKHTLNTNILTTIK